MKNTTTLQWLALVSGATGLMIFASIIGSWLLVQLLVLLTGVSA